MQLTNRWKKRHSSTASHFKQRMRFPIRLHGVHHMSNNELNSRAGTGSTSANKLWGIVGVVVMIFILSRVGVPISLLKNILPFGARHALANACDECDGDGKTEKTCVRCFGRGYYKGVNCTECNKSGKVEEACRFCGGSGKKPTP